MFAFGAGGVAGRLTEGGIRSGLAIFDAPREQLIGGRTQPARATSRGRRYMVRRCVSKCAEAKRLSQLIMVTRWRRAGIVAGWCCNLDVATVFWGEPRMFQGGAIECLRSLGFLCLALALLPVFVLDVGRIGFDIRVESVGVKRRYRGEG